MQLAQSPASSSSPVAYGFNFDSSPRNNGLLSSPASIYSSPMSRSASAQSVFSPFSQTLHTSPLAKVGAAGAESGSSVRPNMKRRRTFAEGASPGELPCSPVKAESVSPVMAARTPKMQLDIWPPDVEKAFHDGESTFVPSSTT